MKPLAIACAFAVTALAPATPAPTILIKKSLAELSRESEAVVLASVVGNSCAWNGERTLIWTTTRLDILESWKGALAGSVEVKEPGGIVGDVGQHVESMARYAPRDTVIVFLKKDVLGQWRTHGCCQGAFRVAADDSGTRRPVVEPSLKHVVEGAFPRLASGELQVPELSGFRALVEQLAAVKREAR